MVPPVVFEPVWLSVDDVKAQLRIDLVDVDDDDLVTRCAAMTEPQVQRARPDMLSLNPLIEPPAPVYRPDAEVYGAAVMLAARLVRRRNSPGGVETFADSLAYVARYDPDIQRSLRLGDYAWPALG
jgi:hypothetical protein